MQKMQKTFEKVIKINRYYKILIISFLVLVIIGVIGLKTNIPKRILNQLNKPLLEEKNRLIKEKEALQKQIKIDSINYVIELEESKKQGEIYKNQFQKARKLNKEYEKAFNNYTTGDYHNNFRIFSRFVTGRDTLSIDRFDIDN